jgi:hypothetical protein
MAENNDLVRCPFCLGRGELRRSEVHERLADSDLPQKLKASLAEIAEPEDEAVAERSQPRSFIREVHAWNPRLPIWRRSPKE